MVRLSFSSFVLCISWVQHQVYWFFSLWTLLYCQPREKWINLSFCYRNTNKQRCTDEIETGRHRVRFWTTHVSNSISEIRGWFFWFSSAKQPIHFGAKDMPSFLVDDKTTLFSLQYIFSVSVMNLQGSSITWSYPKYSFASMTLCCDFDRDVLGETIKWSNKRSLQADWTRIRAMENINRRKRGWSRSIVRCYSLWGEK